MLFYQVVSTPQGQEDYEYIQTRLHDNITDAWAEATELEIEYPQEREIDSKTFDFFAVCEKLDDGCIVNGIYTKCEDAINSMKWHNEVEAQRRIRIIPRYLDTHQYSLIPLKEGEEIDTDSPFQEIAVK